MKFTAHNILLSNNRRTIDGDQILLGESALWRSIEKSLNLFNLLPQSKEERQKLKVVDLGCLEGGYSVEFAKLGFNTLGIEAREENILKCNYVKSELNLQNLNFIKDDVRNLNQYGEFDIVVCYGLLYHLNDPIDFLKKISLATKKILFLHTHFAPEKDIRYDLGYLNSYIIAPLQKRIKLLNFSKNYKLSRLVQHEGYKGRWYNEWSDNSTKSKIEKQLWASYNNSKSFWLCKKDLTKAMHNVGFNNVFEQFNYTGDLISDDYTQVYNRTMFVGVKK
jgi:hypothetical protein